MTTITLSSAIWTELLSDGVASAKGTSLAMEYGLLESDGETIQFQTTTLDISVTRKVRLAAKPFKVALHYPTLHAASNRPGNDLTLTIGDQEAILSVSGQRSRYKIPLFPHQDWPDIHTEGLETILADSGILARAMEHIAYAAADKDTRYYLNGAYFDGDFIVATDAHRLAAYHVSNGPQGMIVPNASIRHVIRGLRGTQAHIQAKENRLRIEADEISVETALIEGRYPAWRSLIKADQRTPITVNRDALLESVRRIYAINALSLGGKKEMANITLKSAQDEQAIGVFGNNEESVEWLPARVENNVHTTIRATYLIDMISHCDSNDLILHIPEDPLKYTNTEDLDHPQNIYLVMPVRE